jgi:hypothetical protein
MIQTSITAVEADNGRVRQSHVRGGWTDRVDSVVEINWGVPKIETEDVIS